MDTNSPASTPQSTLSSLFLVNLALEKAADLTQTEQLLKSLSIKQLVNAQLAINNLVFESIRTGLGGRIILELKSDPATGEFKSGDFRIGDIVKVMNKQSSAKEKKSLNKDKAKNKDNKEQAEGTDVEGVISRISQDTVVVSIDEMYAELCVDLNRLCLVKLANSVTYKRMESTMRKLSEMSNTDLPPMFQSLLGANPYTYMPPSTPIGDMTFTNNRLNDSQKRAIQYSLGAPLTLVHGPPGTGKTTTLVETILHLTAKGERVLVCGPSNISVDTILERLSPHYKTNELIRIGHPSRLLESNFKHCLDLILDDADDGIVLKELKTEIDNKLKKKVKKSKTFKEKRAIYAEVKDLRKDLKVRERKCITTTILHAKVIVATLHGSSSRELTNIYKDAPSINLFDTIIIDEISQSMEPQCWIPLIHHKSTPKLILAGDNKQLPPTVKTTIPGAKAVLERTIFDRLISFYGSNPPFKKFLDVQYRMNEDIIEFSSKTMYDGELKSHISCADIALPDLPGVEHNDTTIQSLVWYDTQGGLFPERSDDVNDPNLKGLIQSKFNYDEVDVIAGHVEKLINAGCAVDNIGIISPYSSQVALLKKELRPKYERSSVLEISTVDGFQGREKEVIIISLVRSNDDCDVGFLKDERRMNVAITRAKRQLVFVGDMETLEGSGNGYLKKLVEYMEDKADLIYPEHLQTMH